MKINKAIVGAIIAPITVYSILYIMAWIMVHPKYFAIMIVIVFTAFISFIGYAIGDSWDE